MLEILINTPIWVYITFTIILYFGLVSCSSGKISIKKIFYLPSIFICLSIYSLIINYGLIAEIILSWSLSLLLATTVVYLLSRNNDNSFYLEEGKLFVPGDYSILLVSLFVFAIKYWFGYTSVVDPEFSSLTYFKVTDSLVSGLAVGFFCGRGLVHNTIAKRLHSKVAII